MEEALPFICISLTDVIDTVISVFLFIEAMYRRLESVNTGWFCMFMILPRVQRSTAATVSRNYASRHSHRRPRLVRSRNPRECAFYLDFYIRIHVSHSKVIRIHKPHRPCALSVYASTFETNPDLRLKEEAISIATLPRLYIVIPSIKNSEESTYLYIEFANLKQRTQKPTMSFLLIFAAPNLFNTVHLVTLGTGQCPAICRR